MNIFCKLIFLGIVILTPYLAKSGDVGGNVARWYKVYWSGVYIADFKVEVGENRLVSQIDSRGVVRKISKYSNHIYAKFNINNGDPTQEYFESHLTQRQGRKDITIYYSQDGKIRTEIVSPPDNRSKRPAVEDNLKNNAVNPLFAAILARDKIKYNIAKGNKRFSFDIYDGRRLSQLEFNILTEDNIKVLGKEEDVVKISFKRIPIAGFTENELKRMKGEEPEFVVYLEEETLLPIKADAAAPLGKAYFVLEKECKSIDECR